jgi:hypothetical protein
MLLNLLCYDSRLQTSKQRFALSYRQAHRRWRHFFGTLDRVHLVFDWLTRNPSTNSLIVHFIPRG